MARRHLAPHHAAVAGRRRIDVDEIGDRRGNVRVKPRLRKHRIGAARRGNSLVRRPAVARTHQPQIVEAAIHHRPRGGADVLAELRFDQDDRGTIGHRLPAMIGAGHLTRRLLKNTSDCTEPIRPYSGIGGHAVAWDRLYVAENGSEITLLASPLIILYKKIKHRVKGLFSR